MSLAYRIKCDTCPAVIARGTYEELQAAIAERDWLHEGTQATCLSCRIG